MAYLANIYNNLLGPPKEPDKITESAFETLMTGQPVIDIKNLLNLGFCVAYANASYSTIDGIDCFMTYRGISCKDLANGIFVKVIIPDYFVDFEKNANFKGEYEITISQPKKFFAIINYKKRDLSKLKFCRINRQTKNIIRHYYKQIALPTITYN